MGASCSFVSGCMKKRKMSRRISQLLCILIITCLACLIFVIMTYEYRGYDGDYFHLVPETIKLMATYAYMKRLSPKTNPKEMIASGALRKPKVRNYDTSRSCYRQIQFWIGSDTAQEPETILSCPDVECGVRVMRDRSFKTMMKSDILVHDFLLSKWSWSEMLRRRPSHQAWAFQTLEPTPLPRQDLEHVYNYSITYRRSSTFYRPYGKYDKSKPQIPPNDNRDWAHGRSNMVAWVSSNCYFTSWRRLGFARELGKHIQVDIYGGCGKPCERYSDRCRDLLRTYKFYLALENTVCTDYITEKFWENAFQHDLIPIVYGARKEDYEAVAPPNSFIHLDDFTSMGDLVKYLNLLNSNDTLYNAYFEWKRHGSIMADPNGDIPCRLMGKFLKAEKGLPSGLERDGANATIYKTWRGGCHKPTGFPQDF